MTLLVATSAARADGFDDFVHARRMRKSGAGLMAVGLIHLSVGLALGVGIAAGEAQCANKPFPCDEGAGFLIFPMIGLLAVGGVLSVIGIPLFAVGHGREKKWRQALTPTPMGQLTPVPPMPQ
ncbi:MAG TPA: hypothetical protein VGL86_17855 [Polyangia bacterium]